MLKTTATFLLLSPLLFATDLFVAPSGDDLDPGSADRPFATIEAARDAARSFAGREAVTVHVADGTYYLQKTLVFGPEDSGSAEHLINYRANHEGGVVLSGGLLLETDWRPHKDGILKTSTPEGLEIDQVFLGGERQIMARYPNHDPKAVTAAYQGFAADAFSKERAKRWKDPTGGYIHAMHVARWGGYHYRITGKKADGTVAYEGGWQNNRRMGMHKEFRMVENIFEELDAPGEWFHDAGTRTLYLFPPDGIRMEKAAVEVVRLSHLVEIRGTEDKPVHHLGFNGFVFRHTSRTFMDTREPLLRSDWAIYRGGAVFITGGEDISVTNSEFDQPGGNAVFVNYYNRRIKVKGCHIHDTGASGICFVGDPKAVRDPLFEYAETNDLSKIDRTPGPKTNNFPADSSVEDCLIHGIGRVERQPAGVQISMAARIQVSDCSIYDCARSGINVSEGTWGGHLIEGCDVFDTVLETHDHGSFNSWGRDRFWRRDHRQSSQAAVDKDPKLPYLDAVETTVIRNSRWRCDHGWDIDLDDGSSNYEIYNNLLLSGGLKFREGYGRKAYNNVIVNNGFHPHVWFANSDSSFQRNIVMEAHANIGCAKDWTRQVDHNFYGSNDILGRCQSMGGDAQSMAGDPQFLDPEAGDFRVADDSLALGMGFRNFPMDRFGVRKPSLRTMARTPKIPKLKAKVSTSSETPGYWLGARLHSLVGEEFSAFGTAREDGGVQLMKMAPNSLAAANGLKTNDLIQKLNGITIRSTDDLFTALNQLEEVKLIASVVRNQQPVVVTFDSVRHVVVESADRPEDFQILCPGESVGAEVSVRPGTHNEGLDILFDGRLASNYGPVFGNGTEAGYYRLDLGKPVDIDSVTAWTFNQDGRRSALRINLYGSNVATDPGWETSEFTPLGTLDTQGMPRSRFQAASLKFPPEATLGSFRWILIESFPLNEKGEHPALQELRIESR